MWQKCPICNGSGRTHNTLTSSSFDICSTCNGTKIISELNGLPPNCNGKIVTEKFFSANDVLSNYEEYLTTFGFNCEDTTFEKISKYINWLASK